MDVQGEATLISAIYIKPNSILYGIIIDFFLKDPLSALINK